MKPSKRLGQFTRRQQTQSGIPGIVGALLLPPGTSGKAKTTEHGGEEHPELYSESAERFRQDMLHTDHPIDPDAASVVLQKAGSQFFHISPQVVDKYVQTYGVNWQARLEADHGVPILPGKELDPGFVSTALRLYKEPFPKMRVIIMAAGTGKTYFSSRYAPFFDIDDVINDKSDPRVPIIKRERGIALRSGSWERVNAISASMILEAYLRGRFSNKIVLVHGTDYIPHSLAIDILGDYKTTEVIMQKRRDERMIVNEQWGLATESNWKSSTGEILSIGELDSVMARHVQREQSDRRFVSGTTGQPYAVAPRHIHDAHLYSSGDRVWHFFPGAKTVGFIPAGVAVIHANTWVGISVAGPGRRLVLTHRNVHLNPGKTKPKKGAADAGDYDFDAMVASLADIEGSTTLDVTSRITDDTITSLRKAIMVYTSRKGGHVLIRGKWRFGQSIYSPEMVRSILTDGSFQDTPSYIRAFEPDKLVLLKTLITSSKSIFPVNFDPFLVTNMGLVSPNTRYFMLLPNSRLGLSDDIRRCAEATGATRTLYRSREGFTQMGPPPVDLSVSVPYDFLWIPLDGPGGTHYRMGFPGDPQYSMGQVVLNYQDHYGFGHLACLIHRGFGVGRHHSELLEQDVRPSGHFINSCIMGLPAQLLYFSEIIANMDGDGHLALKVEGNHNSVFHRKLEYQLAIKAVMRASDLGEVPPYALEQSKLASRFLDLLPES